MPTGALSTTRLCGHSHSFVVGIMTMIHLFFQTITNPNAVENHSRSSVRTSRSSFSFLPRLLTHTHIYAFYRLARMVLATVVVACDVASTMTNPRNPTFVVSIGWVRVRPKWVGEVKLRENPVLLLLRPCLVVISLSLADRKRKWKSGTRKTKKRRHHPRNDVVGNNNRHTLLPFGSFSLYCVFIENVFHV